MHDYFTSGDEGLKRRLKNGEVERRGTILQIVRKRGTGHEVKSRNKGQSHTEVHTTTGIKKRRYGEITIKIEIKNERKDILNREFMKSRRANNKERKM